MSHFDRPQQTLTDAHAQINTHDAVESDVPTGPHATGLHRSPRSPPPSFHSRPSSLRPGQRVDPNLADAFDAAEDSDDEDTGDDTQRLVRGGPSSPDTHQGSGPLPPRRPTPQAGANGVASRVYGGGIQSDGVFSNLTAKPERPNGEKEEQPPVRCVCPLHFIFARTSVPRCSH